MTGKERMLRAMASKKADCVPVAPSMSNMIPCRLTGRPFWDIYLYQKIPLWQAYCDAVKHFGFDGWLTYGLNTFTDTPVKQLRKEVIVKRTEDRIYTRFFHKDKKIWSENAILYPIDNPPWHGDYRKLGLPERPEIEEEVERKNNLGTIEDYLYAYGYMGDDGIVSSIVNLPGIGAGEEAVYRFYDNRDAIVAECRRQQEKVIEFTQRVLELRKTKRIKIDYFFIHASGHMIWNLEPVFREVSLPCLKEVTWLCKKAGLPTMLHCCGPETSLAKIAAEETDLSCINPLEMPPMGDCNLRELKEKFGHKICLMGNLHTINVMGRGSAKEVIEASKKAIDDAAENGGFILSTGDQCPRETPEENIFAMVKTARTYGRY